MRRHPGRLAGRFIERGCLEDEPKGVVRMAMVVFEEVCQRLPLLKGDDGQKDVAGEGEIERGVGFAMAVPVFLPGAGVAFVVVAVFHGPMLAGGVGRAGFLVGAEAGKEEAGVSFLGLGEGLFSPTNHAEP